MMNRPEKYDLIKQDRVALCPPDADWKHQHVRSVAHDFYGPALQTELFLPKTYYVGLVVEGSLYFQSGDCLTTINAGECLVIIPDYRRVQFYTDGQPAEVWNIDFAGEAIEELARTTLGMTSGARSLRNPTAVIDMMALLLRLAGIRGENSERAVHAALPSLLHLIALSPLNEKQEWQTNAFHKCQSYIANHCDQGLTVEQVAKHVNMSTSSLHRLFDRMVGMSPQHFILEQRIEIAKSYLTRSDLSIKEIADRLSYANAFSFTKAFKRIAGISPSTFRRPKTST